MTLTAISPVPAKADGEEVVPAVENITRIVLLVEYDGSRYHGFQFQAELPTVQDEIEKALKKLTGEDLRVAAASRTDSGVHARGQVVDFRTKSALDKKAFVGGLNYYLPSDIAVKEACKVGDGFRVRSSAVSREYKYYILNSKTRSPLWDKSSYRVSGELDIEAMNRAARLLVGRHDLASFMSNLGVELKSTVRRVSRAEVCVEGEMVVFNIAANSFLPHQVRNTIGALLRVGTGRMTADEFHSIIEAKQIGLAGPSAPARGLCLMKVNYRKNLEEYDIENL